MARRSRRSSVQRWRMAMSSLPRCATCRPTAVERPLHLLTLSGKTEEALKQLAVRYADSLAANPSMALADLCFSANTGRLHFNHRLSIVAWSVTQARKQLRAFIAGQEPTGVFK